MHCIRNKAQITLSRVVFHNLSFFVMLLLALFLDGCAYLYDYYTGPDTSLSNYLMYDKDGWLCENPYELFPALATVQSAEAQHYLHKEYTSPTLLLDNDILTYLSCTYTAADYSAEINRLETLCGSMDAQEFRLPAYVLVQHFPNGFSEYALVDETSHTIFYFSVQGTMLLEKYVPQELHPISSQSRSTDG